MQNSPLGYVISGQYSRHSNLNCNALQINKETRDLQYFLAGTELDLPAKRCSCKTVDDRLSFQEKQEMKLINENIVYNRQLGAFECGYPTIRSLSHLHDNKGTVIATFKQQERNMRKKTGWRDLYNASINELVAKNFAVKLDKNYIKSYTNPVWYLSVVLVAQPKSKSSPFRVTFNGSQTSNGISFNRDFVIAGPSPFPTSIPGLMLNFMAHRVACVGD